MNFMTQPLTEKRNLQAVSGRPSFVHRLWQYQRERFPLGKHGLLLATFSFCAVALSAQLRGAPTWPTPASASVAFVSLLLFFLQLRIADEFKDAAVDAQYRPERPVPRGLVTLRELGRLAVAAALIQIVLARWLDPWLLLPLVGVWLYMALMRVEFGVADWLHRHPFTYLWTHMLVVPLIDLYATACDWLPQQHGAQWPLFWFLAVSFCNGVVIEIGRKTWAPAQERPGVESYSSSWGVRRAITVWLLALLAATLCALPVAHAIDFFWPLLLVLLSALVGVTVVGVRFVRRPTAAGAAQLETLSGLWVAGLYLSLGIIPLGVHLWF